ncbi:MAG: hypothetical protein HFH69_12495 [Lachnospiraceae bacterium]|nr:hypothetical protein [Lachnospiraceae bacterium]
MKDYTAENPEYKGNIKLLETTDTDHAENFNIPYRQLMDNTAANHEAIEGLQEDVGNINGVHVGASAPEKTSLLWIDTTCGGVTKYYDGTNWMPTAIVLTSTPSSVVGAMWFE